MLYLRTGANGSCKTLFTLQDVRALQLETNRPVCVNQRFKIKPHKLAEFGWRVIEFKDWEDQPDGTIFMMDECHNDLPLRPNSAPVPKYVAMLAEHRARGFDFYLLTQHPMNIDSFVRKLIGAPGWHQHLKRRFGAANTTTVLQWPAVRSDCEKDGSGKSAQITARKQPVEVYDWYESAELHTGKMQIPKQVYVAIACLVGVVVLVFAVYLRVKPGAKPDKAPDDKTAPAAATPSPIAQQGAEGAPSRALTPAELVASYTPRIEGMPQTAPRYDSLTNATTAPYPAACVRMGPRCQCYSQQGTRLEVPLATCAQIVERGFFMDWQAGPSNAAQPVSQSIKQVEPQQVATGPVAIAMQANASPSH